MKGIISKLEREVGRWGINKKPNQCKRKQEDKQGKIYLDKVEKEKEKEVDSNKL